MSTEPDMSADGKVISFHILSVPYALPEKYTLFLPSKETGVKYGEALKEFLEAYKFGDVSPDEFKALRNGKVIGLASVLRAGDVIWIKSRNQEEAIPMAAPSDSPIGRKMGTRRRDRRHQGEKIFSGRRY